MSGILMSFDYNRRVAINDRALSDNTFEANVLLNPDGDLGLSRKYGTLRLRITGDSSKVPDLSLSEVEGWLSEAVTALLASKAVPHHDEDEPADR